MPGQDYLIRLMQRNDIPQVLEMWKENYSYQSETALAVWLEVDPQGFYVAVSETGDVVGVCAAVLHHDDLVFFGSYAVRKSYRNRGIGFPIWKTCYERAGPRNAGLNATVEKAELYRNRGGFPLQEREWWNMTFKSDNVLVPEVLNPQAKGVKVRRVRGEDTPLVTEYDSCLVGYNRSKAVALTLLASKSAFLATKKSKCVGYGAVSINIEGYVLVGPLYADSQEVAEAILRSLLEDSSDYKGLIMVLVSTNEAAKSMVARLGLKCFRQSLRCYKKHQYDIDTSKVYGQFNVSFAPY